LTVAFRLQYKSSLNVAPTVTCSSQWRPLSYKWR